MNLEAYLQEKERRRAAEKAPRPNCPTCRRPQAACYCARVHPFAPEPRFVILIHKNEARRSIATGRMAHLCLSNSLLLEGSLFADSEPVNALIRDPGNHPVVLFPGPGAVDISELRPEQKSAVFPPGKRPVIFVVDATWAQAKRVRRLSPNLASLPMIRFTPKTPSNFHVRRQPSDECYSTIEAIHWLLGRLDESETPNHRNLLEVFDFMVQLQLKYELGRRTPAGTRRRGGRPVGIA